MKEVEVQEHVLKWGLAQNPTLVEDPNTWSDDDFKMMKKISEEESNKDNSMEEPFEDTDKELDNQNHGFT
ncbi:hypothetical protein C1645_813114 [Glomus cerebriforme]|uniref:Uncharacterized protein n=1 Tax=Glomus cerebriforme TaxID=658196 RepID=A0A397TJR8_9GLOM|nr:hypothetical protein C1645_813114 [Glomus cerebriforme]